MIGAQVVNELHQRTNHLGTLDSIPVWNNSWPGFTYLPAKLRITRAPSPRNRRVNSKKEQWCILTRKLHKQSSETLMLPVLPATKTPNYFLLSPLLLLCKGANLSNHQNLPQSCVEFIINLHTCSHKISYNEFIISQNNEKWIKFANGSKTLSHSLPSNKILNHNRWKKLMLPYY